jgi:hypothetical protein
MTSESDSPPRRRPPTIDLTATEIETEKPAAEARHRENPALDNALPEQPSKGATWKFGQPHVIGAAVGALVMAVILGGLWLAGILPAPNGSLAGTNNTASGISSQLDKIQAELQAQPPQQAQASRLTAVEAQTKALGDSLAALNRRLDDTAVAEKSSVQHSDLDALTGRIAALEDNVKTLSDNIAHRPASADDRVARTAVAAEALRAVG